MIESVIQKPEHGKPDVPGGRECFAALGGRLSSNDDTPVHLFLLSTIFASYINIVDPLDLLVLLPSCVSFVTASLLLCDEFACS
jgi:hypothetical protein